MNYVILSVWQTSISFLGHSKGKVGPKVRFGESLQNGVSCVKKEICAEVAFGGAASDFESTVLAYFRWVAVDSCDWNLVGC